MQTPVANIHNHHTQNAVRGSVMWNWSSSLPRLEWQWRRWGISGGGIGRGRKARGEGGLKSAIVVNVAGIGRKRRYSSVL